MAISSIANNLFSFFTPSKPPPPLSTPKNPPSHLSDTTTTTTTSSRKDGWAPLVLSNENDSKSLLSSSCSSDVISAVCPSLAYANTLFFRSGYNVQVFVDDNEQEEKLLNRFRREVMKAGVIQECKRRRFFENTQDEKKRKSREAAKRNRQRRFQPKSSTQNRSEISKNKKEDGEEDNWELPSGGNGPSRLGSARYPTSSARARARCSTSSWATSGAGLGSSKKKDELVARGP